MHRIHWLVLALPTVLIACGGTSIDSLRAGIPSSDTVQLSFPNQPGRLVAGQTQQAVRGDRSGFYTITRGVTVVVNLSTALVLGLVKAISDNPPTSFSGNVAVWGPYTDPLSSNTYRFTATDNGNHRYSYLLEGKAKVAPDSAYVAILSGTHIAAADASGHPSRGYGSGFFLIDWDKAQTLPDHDDSVGAAQFNYSRLSSAASVHIAVTFTQVMDAATHQRVNADYLYDAAPGADGLFQFSNYKPTPSGIQRFAIESRWKNNGAGRSDVIVTGGGLSQPATVNECWDQFFASQFLSVSYDPSQNYGVEATDCVFTPAEYSPL